MKSKVSVVIPVYNSGKFLLETIASVDMQTYENVELIIVNNCSTEKHTLDILKTLRENRTVVDSSLTGLSQARNDGIKKASGTFILPLDADDIIKPTFIDRCIDQFNTDISIKVVRSQVELFGVKNGTIFFDEYCYNKLLARNLMVATSMFKKEDWSIIGGYDTSFTTCFEDWEFWINLLKGDGKVGTVNETLFRYRTRKGSMMNSLNLIDLKRVRKQIWKKHKAQFGKHFVDPVECFEYKYVADSKAFKMGNILLKPFERFKLMKG
ncbi:MAG: glycosyltransferase involved in cell wall biosynthesis [Patiriisocius sp.]|jgi:glycosyltransferase involved in cell wall biosynthesis